MEEEKKEEEEKKNLRVSAWFMSGISLFCFLCPNYSKWVVLFLTIYAIKLAYFDFE